MLSFVYSFLVWVFKNLPLSENKGEKKKKILEKNKNILLYCRLKTSQHTNFPFMYAEQQAITKKENQVFVG